MTIYKNILLLEVEGGTDKESDGHRKDTFPILDSLNKKGWNAHHAFYRDAEAEALVDRIKSLFDSVVGRINPGDIPGGEDRYFAFLRKLSDAGVIVMPHPDVMTNFGAKDALSKLASTGLVPDDTVAYNTYEEFKSSFPTTLSKQQRVIKQNRGSSGEGIWHVSVEDERNFGSGPLPADSKIKCTEAVDNHVEHRELGEFMDFCKQYLSDGGRLVDMRYLLRIKEGERRIIFVGETPIFVVHRQPLDQSDAFSATVGAGATYMYLPPSNYKDLLDHFKRHSKTIYSRLSVERAPLIWTADFILDWTNDGKDVYYIGELNCSCVGFTTHLNMGIQDLVADEIIRVVQSVKGSQ